jgi:hypothetical protein
VFLFISPNGVYEKRKSELILDKKNLEKWLSKHQYEDVTEKYRHID